jgi:hypothetical protein
VLTLSRGKRVSIFDPERVLVLLTLSGAREHCPVLRRVPVVPVRHPVEHPGRNGGGDVVFHGPCAHVPARRDRRLLHAHVSVRPHVLGIRQHRQSDGRTDPPGRKDHAPPAIPERRSATVTLALRPVTSRPARDVPPDDKLKIAEIGPERASLAAGGRGTPDRQGAIASPAPDRGERHSGVFGEHAQGHKLAGAGGDCGLRAARLRSRGTRPGVPKSGRAPFGAPVVRRVAGRWSGLYGRRCRRWRSRPCLSSWLSRRIERQGGDAGLASATTTVPSASVTIKRRTMYRPRDTSRPTGRRSPLSTGIDARS